MNLYIRNMVRRIKYAVNNMQNLSFSEFQKELPSFLDDNFSFGYLDYLFTKEIGRSISEYFTKKKIEKASELFYLYHLNPLEVAYQLGYHNQKELTSDLRRSRHLQLRVSHLQ